MNAESRFDFSHFNTRLNTKVKINFKLTVIYFVNVFSLLAYITVKLSGVNDE